MGHAQGSARITLQDWEGWLAPQVRQAELLGEIPITAEESLQLGKAIGLRVRGLGRSRALGLLERDYPCALAVCLVAQGVYGYRGGDYWGEVVQATDLRRAYTWQVGQAFEAILETMGPARVLRHVPGSPPLRQPDPGPWRRSRLPISPPKMEFTW